MDIAEVPRVRGTIDLVPEQAARLERLTELLRQYFERFGYRPDQRSAIKQRILELLGAGPEAPLVGDGETPSSLVEELGAGDATRMTIDLLERASLGLEGGSRSPEEIVRRLLSKG